MKKNKPKQSSLSSFSAVATAEKSSEIKLEIKL